MEAIGYSAELINVTIAVGGFLMLLAVALASILLGYVADEEAKGRRIEWLEEPLATAGPPARVAKVELRRAA